MTICTLTVCTYVYIHMNNMLFDVVGGTCKQGGWQLAVRTAKKQNAAEMVKERHEGFKLSEIIKVYSKNQ